jgi:hypothetical protein
MRHVHCRDAGPFERHERLFLDTRVSKDIKDHRWSQAYENESGSHCEILLFIDSNDSASASGGASLQVRSFPFEELLVEQPD